MATTTNQEHGVSAADLPELLAHAFKWVAERDQAIATNDIRRTRRADLMLNRKRDEILVAIDYK